MKKILIVTMSCNDKFFASQIEDIKKTWASDLPSNVEWLYYTGDEFSKTYLDGDHLVVSSEDDLVNTFKKTVYALSYCIDNFDFDYIVRTNTSTYINVKFLSYFIEKLSNEGCVYGSELYSLTEGYAPRPLDIYARGNCMILDKLAVVNLINNALPFVFLEKVDDMMIGNILNSYWLMRNEDYMKHIKGCMHGWYKCVPVKYNSNHRLCEYGHSEGGIDFYSKFISIQIKNYVDRSKESDAYKELHSYFVDWNPTEEELEKLYNQAVEYSNNPSIFIGSILGYIDLNTWKSIDKDKLYWTEFSNKAVDDVERLKYIKYLERKKNMKKTK